jgi:hypothetical protein
MRMGIAALLIVYCASYAGAETLFFDDFEDGPDSDWNMPNGGWVGENGVLNCVTSCGFGFCNPNLYAGGPDYLDYVVSFDFLITQANTNHGSSVACYIDLTNPVEFDEGTTSGYIIGCGYSPDGNPNNANCGIQRIDNSATPYLAEATGPEFWIEPGILYHMKIGREGNNLGIKKWTDGDPEPEWMLVATDDTYHGGYWMPTFWNQLGWIDNFLVEGSAPAQLNFGDITASSGLAGWSSAGSLSWMDFNDDGYGDLLGASQAGTPFLYLNDGSGVFTGQSQLLGSINQYSEYQIQPGDYDNDGDWDLLAFRGTSPEGHCRLWENRGGEYFDVTPPVLADLGRAYATFVDLDGDGHLEIITTSMLGQLNVPIHVLKLSENGDWAVQQVVESAPGMYGYAASMACGDLDDDGRTDVLAVTQTWGIGFNLFPMAVLRNDEESGLVPVANSGLGPMPEFPISFIDYDNDGDLDVHGGTTDYVQNGPEQVWLWRNDGGWSFTDVSQPGMHSPGSNYYCGAKVADPDRDGDWDYYQDIGAWTYSRFFANEDGLFVDRTLDVGLPMAGNGDSNAYGLWADIDGDHTDDLIISANRNTSGIWMMKTVNDSPNNWLEIAPQATVSNSGLFGVNVKVYLSDRVLRRFFVENDPVNYQNMMGVARFGLGNHTTADSVTVTWPSGFVSRVYGVLANQKIIVDEPPKPAVPEGVLFFDDFEDGADSAWNMPDGGWVGGNGVLYCVTSCGFGTCNPNLYAGGPGYLDYVVSFDFLITQANTYHGSSVACYIDLTNPIEFDEGTTSGYIIGGGWSSDGNPNNAVGGIQRIDNSTVVDLVLANGPQYWIEPGTLYHMKVGRNGGNLAIKKWTDGEPEPDWMLSVADDTYHGGYWMPTFWNQLGWIDNFLVEGPGAFRVRVEDVPDDEGGVLEASWTKHRDDSSSALHPVTSYEVQKLANAWEMVASIAAAEADSYTVQISTPDVYTIGQPEPFSAYRVVAQTDDPGVFFASAVDSAYSIDNLPPSRPQAQLTESGGYVVITWPTPEIPDFSEACIYRGTSSDFIPEEPFVCTEGGGYPDAISVLFYYTVQFSDIHGNVSEFSDIVSLLTAEPQYDEDFNDGVAEDFEVVSGNWEVINGQYHCYNSQAGVKHITTVGEATWSDYRFACDIQVTGAPEQEFLFRYQSPGDWYLFGVLPSPYNTAVLWKSVGGLQYLLAQVNNVVNAPNQLRHLAVEVQGATISAYFDGQLLLTYEDTDQPFLTGKVGLDAFADSSVGWQHAYFDNVSVEAIGTATAVPSPVFEQSTLQSYPNPFNPQTRIAFSLPTPGKVSLAVFDMRGRLVRTLVDDSLAAGAHTVTWDGRDAVGASMPSGTYFCRLTSPWGVETRKMGLIR